ncbi:TauD/TfdA family dioxygenase [Ramlibacter sp. AW1]|uniref:TauD/TfdA family dioxygenase n=1 Tax=Ramlibacter aurantiacus TaxID=2801330 RepID=A0A937D5F5_9BURK|nr:TauD/TfdA family dioxygenase [Ramlibacter aurantiacus]MBL0419858.1 TauD/TfdA family dioxygenase [Ramlibacter aurantiacus]
MSSSLLIEPVTPAVGAEIRGVDLSQPLEAQTVRAIRQALVDHGVIFLRDQRIDRTQYEAFAECFGQPRLPDSGIIPPLPGSRFTSEVRKDEGRERNIGGSWHTDQVYRAQPSWGSMLLCRQLPPTGGDTLFSSLGAAYDTLSDGLKKTLEPLRAVHSNAAVQARMKTGREPDPEVAHPVVLRHPDSGRRILYISPGYTTRFEGWTEAESRPLLEYLFQHGQRPEFTMRWRWREGSIAFWDNYQTWHFAVNDYAAGERVMHRIVVEGTPFGR